MNPKKLGLAAVSVLAAGAIIGGSAALASADPTPSTSTSSSANADSTDTAGPGARQGHSHTDATTDETQKVKDAVAAKDSTVTISTVQKDEDGSFDADGTKADGTNVRYDVSADYATVTEGKGGRGGHGGGSQDTPVTGDEATKVIDAVKAKDSTVTIDTVRKDPDGSYDALGAKADGTKVMFDVSADLGTISDARTGGGHGGKGGPAGQSSSGSSTDANGTSSSTAPTT